MPLVPDNRDPDQIISEQRDEIEDLKNQVEDQSLCIHNYILENNSLKARVAELERALSRQMTVNCALRVQIAELENPTK